LTVETVISPEAFVDKRGHKGSERRCVATGETLSKSDMIRFVMAPDKSLVPDIAEKLPGRGVWVKATEEALKSALTSGGFKRGLKADVKADTDEVIDLTRTLLKKRVLSLLTMSLKAGRIHMGFDQVKSAAQSGPLAWRIEASDGSAGGRSKIRVLTKAMSEEFQRQHTPVIGCFGAEVLGKALDSTQQHGDKG